MRINAMGHVMSKAMPTLKKAFTPEVIANATLSTGLSLLLGRLVEGHTTPSVKRINIEV